MWRLAAHMPTALAAAAAPLLAQDCAQVALGGAKEVRRSWELLRALSAECEAWGGALERLQVPARCSLYPCPRPVWTSSPSR
jgi:hypothetical protein